MPVTQPTPQTEDDPTRGPRGPMGARGTAGERGPRGAAGPAGRDGRPGPRGPQGPTGATGRPGPRGEQGPSGVRGPQGPRGETGFAGPAGDPGKTGPAGATGPQGEPGPKGDTGARGPVGPAGATGQQGAPGTRGDRGPQGERGFDGYERAKVTTPATNSSSLMADIPGLAFGAEPNRDYDFMFVLPYHGEQEVELLPPPSTELMSFVRIDNDASLMLLQGILRTGDEGGRLQARHRNTDERAIVHAGAFVRYHAF